MCSNFDPRTRDNPEAAMLHQPSAAFFNLPHDWAAASNALNRPPVTVAKPEPGTLPGFDSEAHRAFMRGLG